jgi:TonB family protein
VTFVEKVLQEPPPPSPPPPPPAKVVEEKPVIPAVAAPVVRPQQKVRKLAKPPPPKEIVAPREMPKQAPEEVDPSEDKGVAVFGDPGAGDPAGLESGAAEGVAGGQVGGAIELPDGATPPVPSRDNEHPAYPDRARRRGLSDVVTLRVVVLADGSVSNIVVVEGDEPFVDEAVKVVQRWRYEPARFKGAPIAVYRTLRIQFALRG